MISYFASGAFLDNPGGRTSHGNVPRIRGKRELVHSWTKELIYEDYPCLGWD